MDWIIFGLFTAGLLYIMTDDGDTAHLPRKTLKHVDHTITFRNRSVGMCKMPELEHLEEQMN